MAGHPHRRKRAEIEAQELADARELPTEPRSAPAPYTPDLADELITLASHGLSISEIAHHWARSTEELREWAETHTAFAEAVGRARTAAQAWWERSARVAIAGRDNKFPAGAWAMVMRARFPDYREKVEHVHSGGLEVTKRLVLVDLRRDPLTGDQASALPNPLADQGAVRLAAGLTGEGSPDRGLVLDVEAREVTEQAGGSEPGGG